jgi:hypothetical protein
MITSYKGRKLEIGQLVKVYYNLHDGSFSIMDKKTRLVYGHGNNILIKNPSFEGS